MHILLNKQDEWRKASDEVQQELQGLLDNEVREWKSLQGVSVVTWAKHSNNEATDYVALIDTIRDHNADQEATVGLVK